MLKYSFLKLSPIIFVVSLSCSTKPAQQAVGTRNPQITFRDDESGRRLDVLVDEELFTSYQWPANVYKPILYPINTAGGNPITRGFPLAPRPGEREDHRHQVGNWLNYGNVNGLDFWGNGHSGEFLPNGGEIVHNEIEQLAGGMGEGSMVTSARWLDPAGQELLTEKTIFHFEAKGPVRIIDRMTTLTASGSDRVTFKDTKEGMFGIRVARQLELPAEEETERSGDSNVKATGNYRSSEGVTGHEVWSTRAKWMNLSGNLGNEAVSLVICDHPDNLNYPTYWHARGYGLFAANPLGEKDFTKDQKELNFSLARGESVTFRYRIIIASGKPLTDAEINKYANAFARKFRK